MTTGYDFDPDLNVSEMETILSQIICNTSTREYLLKSLSKALYGVPHEEFQIWTGFSGQNGKSFLCLLMDKALGEYSVRGANSIVVGEREQSNSANSAIMSLKNRRFVFFQETSRKKWYLRLYQLSII